MFIVYYEHALQSQSSKILQGCPRCCAAQETGVVVYRQLAPPLRQCSSTFLALHSDYFWAKNQTPVVRQAPYSPDMAPCDFWPFPKLKKSKVGCFSNNENPTRALHTVSLKCCLPSTDAIDRREKIHVYEGSRLPHASALH